MTNKQVISQEEFDKKVKSLTENGLSWKGKAASNFIDYVKSHLKEKYDIK